MVPFQGPEVEGADFVVAIGLEGINLVLEYAEGSIIISFLIVKAFQFCVHL